MARRSQAARTQRLCSCERARIWRISSVKDSVRYCNHIVYTTHMLVTVLHFTNSGGLPDEFAACTTAATTTVPLCH